jgi:hypothetical protein
VNRSRREEGAGGGGKAEGATGKLRGREGRLRLERRLKLRRRPPLRNGNARLCPNSRRTRRQCKRVDGRSARLDGGRRGNAVPVKDGVFTGVKRGVGTGRTSRRRSNLAGEYVGEGDAGRRTGRQIRGVCNERMGERWSAETMKRKKRTSLLHLNPLSELYRRTLISFKQHPLRRNVASLPLCRSYRSTLSSSQAQHPPRPSLLLARLTRARRRP